MRRQAEAGRAVPRLSLLCIRQSAALFRNLWQVSELARGSISRLPVPIKKSATTAIATAVYWPLARISRAAEKAGADVSNFPLSYYRRTSFYTMRTDALDRFGTRLEQRFTRSEINAIEFRDSPPFWVALGYKRR